MRDANVLAELHDNLAEKVMSDTTPNQMKGNLSSNDLSSDQKIDEAPFYEIDQTIDTQGEKSTDCRWKNGDITGDGQSEAHITSNDQEFPRETALHECLQYCNAFEDNFDEEQIHRIARLLRFYEHYSYVTSLLPRSWELIINEVMLMGK